MTKTLLTERTEVLLTSSKFDLSGGGIYIPDNAPCFDKEQQEITETFKKLFGIKADNTFKVALDRQEQQKVYSPSVVNHNGEVAIEWGGEYFPIPEKATFSGSTCTLYVKQGKEKYGIGVRLRAIKKDDAKTDLEKKYVSLAADKKAEFLQDLWDDGEIVELLGGFAVTLKLGEVLGTHDVVGYRLNKFGKYELELVDGRWCRTNTALNDKIESYKELGVEVSPECPARLTVEESTKETAQGHPIYPATLVSFKNVNIPIFDFTNGFGTAKPAEAPPVAEYAAHLEEEDEDYPDDPQYDVRVDDDLTDIDKSEF